MARKFKNNVTFSTEVLEAYQSAAIQNAKALIREAELLLRNGHLARAYFLSVASIEETGKAALAFNGRGRNLKELGIQSRLNVEFQDHRIKNSAAFIALLNKLNESDKTSLRKNLQPIIDLQVSLKLGREPSMYTDINENGAIHTPVDSVSCTAAKDCVRLARDCMTQTEEMLTNTEPFAFSAYQDQLFALGKKAKKVWTEKDFGNYLLDVIEKEAFSSDTLPKAVCTYYKDYLSRGKKFASCTDD